MSNNDHFPNFDFVQQAFLNTVRFLLTHPVDSAELLYLGAIALGLATNLLLLIVMLSTESPDRKFIIKMNQYIIPS